MSRREGLGSSVLSELSERHAMCYDGLASSYKCFFGKMACDARCVHPGAPCENALGIAGVTRVPVASCSATRASTSEARDLVATDW